MNANFNFGLDDLGISERPREAAKIFFKIEAASGIAS
jgi:hypothetical protein